MDLESSVKALYGPELVKIAVAFILIVAFAFWQRKEAEGVMRGYVVASVFVFLRDLVYLAFPDPSFYLATDLVFLGMLAVVFAVPLGLGLSVWLAAGISAAAGFAVVVLALLGPSSPRPELFLLAGLGPILVLFLKRGRAEGGFGQGRKLIRKIRYPLAFASLAYLFVEAFLGPGHFWFHAGLVAAFYAVLALVGFFFVDVLRDELVSAVEYYEGSVDSLYDLFTATGSVIKAGFSLQEVLDGMAGVIVERTGGSGGLVLLCEEADEVLAVRAMTGTFPPPFKLPDSLPKDEERVVGHLRHARFRMGEGLFGELARDGSALLVADAASDPRVTVSGDEDWLRLRSLMAAPLVARDQVIGVVAVARNGDEPFSETDFDRLKVLASFGAIAVSDAFIFLEAAEKGDIDREAAIAEEIQRSVVPKKLPELPGFAVGVYMNPARGVCSDYYDLIRIRGERSLLAFGDVAGKGVAAGIVMAMVRSILHLIVNSTKDASTLMSWVNRGLSGKVDMDHFTTLSLLMVNSATGEIEYANAAHQPLLVYRKEGDSIETVDIKSIPIGVEPGSTYGSKSLRLAPGDVLLLYTDGVVEAMNEQGRQFGRKNLGNSLLRTRDLGAKEIAESIRSDVDDFCGRTRRHDDQTVLVIKARTAR